MFHLQSVILNEYLETMTPSDKQGSNFILTISIREAGYNNKEGVIRKRAGEFGNFIWKEKKKGIEVGSFQYEMNLRKKKCSYIVECTIKYLTSKTSYSL